MRYAVVIEKGPTSYGAYVPDLRACEDFCVRRVRERQLLVNAGIRSS